ncbi:MAG: hypothetical protein U0821_20045 [Chloroflexota bacterium]
MKLRALAFRPVAIQLALAAVLFLGVAIPAGYAQTSPAPTGGSGGGTNCPPPRPPAPPDPKTILPRITQDAERLIAEAKTDLAASRSSVDAPLVERLIATAEHLLAAAKSSGSGDDITRALELARASTQAALASHRLMDAQYDGDLPSASQRGANSPGPGAQRKPDGQGPDKGDGASGQGISPGPGRFQQPGGQNAALPKPGAQGQEGSQGQGDGGCPTGGPNGGPGGPPPFPGAGGPGPRPGPPGTGRPGGEANSDMLKEHATRALNMIYERISLLSPVVQGSSSSDARDALAEARALYRVAHGEYSAGRYGKADELVGAAMHALMATELTLRGTGGLPSPTGTPPSPPSGW